MSETHSHSDVPHNTPPAPPGLPPVLPPSGRHIVQLFVVPMVIVLVVTGILLFSWFYVAEWFFGGSGGPSRMVENLQSDNFDVRWRAANDLAQVLKRDENLASDPRVGLALAEALRKALDDFRQAGQELRGKQDQLSAREQAQQRKAFLEQRRYIQFLSAALASMRVPIGTDLLGEMALSGGQSGDEKSTVLLRRHGVWTLANLGESVQRYDQLPADRRQWLEAQLQQETHQGGQRGEWAQRGLLFLQGQPSLNVVDTLVECAQAEDRFLRKSTTLALAFWPARSPHDEKRIEDTLLRLTRDTGWGTQVEIGENE
ncbi:MAG: hypothetical protein ACK4RK_10835 [Gemmataceae bacterium]